MNALILLLGGSSQRFGGETPKQFLPIGDELVFERSARLLLEAIPLYHACFVVHRDYLSHMFFLRAYEKLRQRFSKTLFWACPGGESRHESFLAGVRQLKDLVGPDGKILVHDASRPFLNPGFLQTVKDALSMLGPEKPCLIPTIAVSDSLCRSKKRGIVESYENREEFFLIQTPQLLYADALYMALEKSRARYDFPDEGSFMLEQGYPVYTFPGDRENRKITYPTDLNP
ncbi:MAG: 2-C-methyl-D-erythritol 4-phosphate cytidylyltransferase [Leptospiraceae bacterium]|nr:2-C-methyl-D-erythritol 4-phosphate cytidylyltransferase [Leptospiraceae bacterium]MDW8305960.1 IspD/TarI family cytidylyltransferase [Leptospiraceae bacterium]